MNEELILSVLCFVFFFFYCFRGDVNIDLKFMSGKFLLYICNKSLKLFNNLFFFCYVIIKCINYKNKIKMVLEIYFFLGFFNVKSL